jgi:hypothetical protein
MKIGIGFKSYMFLLNDGGYDHGRKSTHYANIPWKGTLVGEIIG